MADPNLGPRTTFGMGPGPTGLRDAIARAAGSGVLDEGSLAAQKKLSGEIERGEVTPPGIADTEGGEQP